MATRRTGDHAPAGRTRRARSGSAPDVVIIGGGIVGMASAVYLAMAGARVTLCERSGIASGASGANSGVVQHPLDPILGELYAETLGLYDALTAADAGFHLPPEPNGILYLSTDQASVGRMAERLSTGFPELAPELLDRGALRSAEPGLAPGLIGCRVRSGYVVPPAAATYAYATWAERLGVHIRLGCEASIEVSRGRIVGARIGGDRVPVAQVLVAAGPWSASVIDPAGRWRPIRPSWGVVLDVEMSEPTRHVLEETAMHAGLIAAARGDGDDASVGWGAGPLGSADAGFSLVPLGMTAAVGSTFLPEEPDPHRWLIPLLTRASGFVPRLADAPVRAARVCARPQSTDGRPLIGASSKVAGLFMCAGHGPWGISTGPASARRVAGLILGSSASVPLPLSPARFASRVAAPAPGQPRAADSLQIR